MKNNFHKKDRKAFTIVELVIVIAVIAILAAVLIPTFANIIKRSQVSADTQLCRNLNTVLTMAVSEGRVPASMYDVLYLVNEAGYRLENLNPTAEGYYFAWDSEGQKMVYIREDLDTIIYPEDYKIDKSKCWITVGDAEEFKRVANAGYGVYLEKNIEEEIELHNVAPNVDTGEFTLFSLKIDGQVVDAQTSILRGNFGSTSLNIGNASYTMSGAIQTLTVGSNVAGMTINGNIGSVSSSISNANLVQVTSTGAIGSITSGSVSNSAGTTFTSSSGAVSGAVDGVVNVSTKEDIENIRTQIANGRTFEGETISLPNDINMAGIAFQPVSNYSRETGSVKNAGHDDWFQGDFDGNNHTIKNFSTNGFSIKGLNAGTNGTSSKFATVYNEAVYGLFGTVFVPAGETIEIKNLTIEADIDMVIDDANKYVGDSVGALIGYAYGEGTLKITNVTINGIVNGYDGIAAFIGRAYGESSSKKLTIEFKDCINNATVNAVRKCGVFLGSASNTNKTFNNCYNNANITCWGKQKDLNLGCKDDLSSKENGKGYYQAGIIMDDGTVARLTVDGVENSGIIKVGE